MELPRRQVVFVVGVKRNVVIFGINSKVVQGRIQSFSRERHFRSLTPASDLYPVFGFNNICK